MSAVADGYIRLNYNSTSVDLPVLISKGLDKAEFFRQVPPINNIYKDGSEDTQFKAFVRKFHIQTNTLTKTQLKAYVSWCLDNNRSIDFNLDGVSATNVKLIPGILQEVKYYNGSILTPYLDLTMDEAIARTSF